MFSIHEMTKVKFLDVQVLSQKNRPPGANAGARISCQADLANSVLAEFDGALRTTLFHKSAASEGLTAKDKRQTLPGIEEVSDLPNLTSLARHVKKLPWDAKLTGYTATIDHGTGGISNLVLGDVVLESFRFLPKEGGSVTVWWAVEAVDVPKLTFAELAALKSREVQMTLKEPEVVADLVDQAAAPQKPRGKLAAVSGKAAAAGDGVQDEKTWPFPDSQPGDDFPVGSPEAAFIASQS